MEFNGKGFGGVAHAAGSVPVRKLLYSDRPNRAGNDPFAPQVPGMLPAPERNFLSASTYSSKTIPCRRSAQGHILCNQSPGVHPDRTGINVNKQEYGVHTLEGVAVKFEVGEVQGTPLCREGACAQQTPAYWPHHDSPKLAI